MCGSLLISEIYIGLWSGLPLLCGDEGSDLLFVLFGELPSVFGQCARCVIFVCGHFTDHSAERGQFYVILFLIGLYPQQRRLPITIEESFGHKVLLLVDKTLSEFLQFLVPWRFLLLAHFDVLASGDLALGLDTLLVLVGAHFVTVDKRVVFPEFAQESFCVV